MMSLTLAILLTSLQPAAEQSDLKTFREEFVPITPGQGKFPARFMMGCEKSSDPPPRKIVLKHNFAVAKYEVTQNLWQTVMGDNPSRWKGPRNSVELISFQEAQTFCKKATTLLRAAKLIEPNEEIRLPTETEWEYAARAGTTTAYSFGDDREKLDDYAWSTHNAAGNDPPVGAKKSNPWGLYDVHGYLSEWCSTSETSKRDDKKTAVLRSGSWKDAAEKLTSCSRSVVSQDLRDDAVGLRCVLADVKSE